MRDYGKVSPQFWVGSTGRKLRGNVEAQIVALYLMTSPHANMIGVFYCPIDYIAKETGLTFEGASKGLRSLIEADFCTFEEDSEYIFVHQFAANQVGEELKASDKRVQGVMNELAKVPKGQCWQAFRARYAVPYNLPIQAEKGKPLRSPFQAPSKPEAETEAEAGAEQEEASPEAPPPTPPAADARGSRLPADWTLPDEWRVWAASARPDLNPDAVAESFRDFWIGKAGKDGRKADWQATWRNWVRSTKATPQSAPARTVPSLAGAL